MTLLQQQSKDLTDDLSKFVSKLRDKVTEKSVHRLRTSVRRMETFVSYTKPKLGKKYEKALDELRVLRKRAGKVRDLDIQIGLLNSVGNGSAAADRRGLLDTLKKKRVRQANRLTSAIKRVEGSSFRDRLERIGEKAVDGTGSNSQPLQAVQKELSQLADEFSTRQALKPARLHELRISLKLLRYRAELASESPEQKEVVERLKSVQDAIGEWHDWELLARSAEKQFGDRINCALLAEIRSLFAAKHSAAVSAAMSLLATCVPPGKKKPTSVQLARPAVQRA
ncbi:MAG TPA: CHAD domain-containing protein [Candidatus Angelobacter sp.]